MQVVFFNDIFKVSWYAYRRYFEENEGEGLRH